MTDPMQRNFTQNPDLTSFYEMMRNPGAVNANPAMQLDGRGQLFFTQKRGRFSNACRQFFAGVSKLFGAKYVGANWSLPDKRREQAAVNIFLNLLQASKKVPEISSRQVNLKNWNPDIPAQLTREVILNLEGKMQENSVNPKKFYNELLKADLRIDLNNESPPSSRANKFLANLNLRLENLKTHDQRKEFTDIYNNFISSMYPQGDNEKLTEEYVAEKANDYFFRFLLRDVSEAGPKGCAKQIVQYNTDIENCLRAMRDSYMNEDPVQFAKFNLNLACIHNGFVQDVRNFGYQVRQSTYLVDSLFNCAVQSACTNMRADSSLDEHRQTGFFEALNKPEVSKVTKQSKELLYYRQIKQICAQIDQSLWDQYKSKFPFSFGFDKQVLTDTRSALFLLPSICEHFIDQKGPVNGYLSDDSDGDALKVEGTHKEIASGVEDYMKEFIERRTTQ